MGGFVSPSGGFASLDQVVPNYSQCHLAYWNAICILYRWDCARLCCYTSQWINTVSATHSISVLIWSRLTQNRGVTLSLWFCCRLAASYVKTRIPYLEKGSNVQCSLFCHACTTFNWAVLNNKYHGWICVPLWQICIAFVWPSGSQLLPTPSS